MISGFDAFVSISLLAFFLILAWLYVKSNHKEVRLIEQVDDAQGQEPHLKRRKKALKMLEEAGYQVLGTGRRVRCDLMLNDRVWDKDLIADFTVMKDGRYYVCKVRPERVKPLPNGKELRGELLPLQMLYRASGCLYLDVMNEKIHVVSFGLYDRKGQILKWRNRLTWIAAGFVLALILR